MCFFVIRSVVVAVVVVAAVVVVVIVLAKENVIDVNDDMACFSYIPHG